MDDARGGRDRQPGTTHCRRRLLPRRSRPLGTATLRRGGLGWSVHLSGQLPGGDRLTRPTDVSETIADQRSWTLKDFMHRQMRVPVVLEHPADESGSRGSDQVAPLDHALRCPKRARFHLRDRG